MWQERRGWRHSEHWKWKLHILSARPLDVHCPSHHLRPLLFILISLCLYLRQTVSRCFEQTTSSSTWNAVSSFHLLTSETILCPEHSVFIPKRFNTATVMIGYVIIQFQMTILEVVLAYLMCYPSICVEGLKKTTTHIRWDDRSSGQNSNLRPHE